jgi:hypothetical protein
MMTWRSAVAVLLSVVGGLGPAAVLLFTYGPHATIGTTGADAVRLTVLFVGLMFGSLACGLAAGTLARGDTLERLQSLMKKLAQPEEREA